MNILCPKCRSSITVSENSLTLTCSNCGLKTDLSGIGTYHGMGTIPFYRDLKGEVIGGYELTELIGIGGMGIVYKARNREDDSLAALKVLNYNPLYRDEFISRFEREAKTLQKLQHPNIVKVLKSGRQGDVYYIVTEYLEGENLLDCLRRKAPDKKEILHIIIRVCSAISHAHSQGIIHRDIKPANIFISDEVKVLDFGLAQITGSDTRLTALTRSDVAMGTINYLSPEQRVSAKKIDERSDIFSIGVVLYEMLTGSLPMGRFEFASRINKKISRRFDRILDKCLNTSPSRRYGSVRDLLKDLIVLKDYVPVRKGFIKGTAVVLFVLFMSAVLYFYRGKEINKKVPGKKIMTDPQILKMLPDKLPHEVIDPHLPLETGVKEKDSRVSKKKKG